MTYSVLYNVLNGRLHPTVLILVIYVLIVSNNVRIMDCFL